MKNKDTLTLTRAGEFSFRTVGDKHCGPARSGTIQVCRYVVRVKCRPELDADGYLFEQLLVQEYFSRIKSVKSTCELLAMRAASELEDVINEANPGIELIWIEVTLAADPYAASMTFRYHPS